MGRRFAHRPGTWAGSFLGTAAISRSYKSALPRFVGRGGRCGGFLQARRAGAFAVLCLRLSSFRQ